MQIEKTRQQLKANPKKWLVTGVAGLIGSNLLETGVAFKILESHDSKG